MAQLTPNDILEISEPIEAIYQRTVDELLINIAHHFNISGWERTRYWEIKKLSELGALTKESAAIIAKNTQMLPAEIEKAFLQVSEKACLDIDPQLRQAAAKGLLQDPATTPTTSVLMRQMVQGYVDQAVDTCNMVNTTMLESTRQVYFKGVQTAVNEATRRELLNIVEAGAFEVATGTETKVQAIRKAMNAITATGITGFYDKAGRKWSAEAYTSMVIRTTAHNAAIQSVKTRQQEFGGGDIFQVSTHPAARPLCYPYQGKFFSWSTSGTFKDGAGHEHTYNYIDDSSYGEPAGLFGINCGHHPIPMIPNYSYPQDGPEMTEEQNKKAYEESQRQRQYERDIREAKRDLEIAKATGDEAAIKAAEQKVAQKQANMRAFTKETGRPRRYDREKIAGTKDIEGYKGYRAQFDSDIPLNKPPKQPHTPDPKAEQIIDELKAKGVKYNAVKEYATQPTEAEIITRLAGGDKTKGSCSSLAFAYCGNKSGLDVIDFRGGQSQHFFSRNYNIEKISQLSGVDATIHEVTKEADETWSIIKALPIGKQYYLRTGRHAAIVQNTASGPQFLEMQSRHDNINGWIPFENNGYWDGPVKTLQKRFGCRKTADITRHRDGTSTVYKKRVLVADVDSFSGNEDFKTILGYINTDVSEQQKGVTGSVK
jgi:hypothetical protein